MDLKDPALLREQCYIDGEWTGTPSLPVTDPATGEKIAAVPDLGGDETRRAIEAADAAFRTWRNTLAKERGILLRRWYDLQIEHQDDLALLMTREQGKPLTEAQGEVLYAASFTEFYAEEARRVFGETIPTHRADARIVVVKQPLGVVGAITPWNFPMAMITRKVAPAIAAGCTVVCKPAPDTPLTALALAELAHRAGLPKGVFNVVTGDALKIGPELTSNPLVRMITFTGSTAVGKILMQQSAGTVKKMGLELGGNAPFIVFHDADLDAAVQGAMGSKYRNTGQTCVCANRFLVQDGIYDRFAEALASEVMKMKVGQGTEVGVAQGPLINQAALEKVERHVADARSPTAPMWLPAANVMRSAAPSTSPRFSPRPRPRCCWRARRLLGRWRRCSGSRPRRRPSRSPTIRPQGLPPISMPATWAGPGGSRRRSNSAWSVLMRASFPPRWRRLAGSRRAGSAARAPITASRSSSR